jgi:hypothetical protein
MPKHRPTAGHALARVAALLALVSLGVSLAGCARSPYIDSRREAGKTINIGASNADVIAICYKGGEPQPDVVKLAESACSATKRVPQYAGHNRFICNITTPSRAYFRCVAPTPAPPAG